MRCKNNKACCPIVDLLLFRFNSSSIDAFGCAFFEVDGEELFSLCGSSLGTEPFFKQSLLFNSLLLLVERIFTDTSPDSICWSFFRDWWCWLWKSERSTQQQMHVAELRPMQIGPLLLVVYSSSSWCQSWTRTSSHLSSFPCPRFGHHFFYFPKLSSLTLNFPRL